jgi:hypothetical protein
MLTFGRVSEPFFAIIWSLDNTDVIIETFVESESTTIIGFKENK